MSDIEILRIKCTQRAWLRRMAKLILVMIVIAAALFALAYFRLLGMI